jgi:hypothetical protein
MNSEQLGRINSASFIVWLGSIVAGVAVGLLGI